MEIFFLFLAHFSDSDFLGIIHTKHLQYKRYSHRVTVKWPCQEKSPSHTFFPLGYHKDPVSRQYTPPSVCSGWFLLPAELVKIICGVISIGA